MLSLFKVFFLVNTLVMPSTCQGIICGTVPEYKESVPHQVQTLTVKSDATNVASRDGITVGVVAKTAYASNSSQVFIPVSDGSLVSSAMKYVGMNWDCTFLVEQSLRDIGIDVGDVGPTGFGSAGVVFYDQSQVQPGDIMMRGGHVSIYIGDGLAIHGGFNGRVVITDTDSSPNYYSSFVRVN